MEKIKKIKIVFIFIICKQICVCGYCVNSCERGDIIILYSQGGYGYDFKFGFCIYFCQIFCLNGGCCIGRDECWCFVNFIGKFCYLFILQLDREFLGRGFCFRVLLEVFLRQFIFILLFFNQLVFVNFFLVKVYIYYLFEVLVQIYQVVWVWGGVEEVLEENSVEIRFLFWLFVSFGYSFWDSNNILVWFGEFFWLLFLVVFRF